MTGDKSDNVTADKYDSQAGRNTFKRLTRTKYDSLTQVTLARNARFVMGGLQNKNYQKTNNSIARVTRTRTAEICHG